MDTVHRSACCMDNLAKGPHHKKRESETTRSVELLSVLYRGRHVTPMPDRPRHTRFMQMAELYTLRRPWVDVEALQGLGMRQKVIVVIRVDLERPQTISNGLLVNLERRGRGGEDLGVLHAHRS